MIEYPDIDDLVVDDPTFVRLCSEVRRINAEESSQIDKYNHDVGLLIPSAVVVLCMIGFINRVSALTYWVNKIGEIKKNINDLRIAMNAKCMEYQQVVDARSPFIMDYVNSHYPEYVLSVLREAGLMNDSGIEMSSMLAELMQEQSQDIPEHDERNPIYEELLQEQYEADDSDTANDDDIFDPFEVN